MADIQISLAAARVNANMTQSQAAKALGVDKTTIVSWEKGRTYPNSILLSRLSDIYKMPIGNILLLKETT